MAVTAVAATSMAPPSAAKKQHKGTDCSKLKAVSMVVSRSVALDTDWMLRLYFEVELIGGSLHRKIEEFWVRARQYSSTVGMQNAKRQEMKQKHGATFSAAVIPYCCLNKPEKDYEDNSIIKASGDTSLVLLLHLHSSFLQQHTVCRLRNGRRRG